MDGDSDACLLVVFLQPKGPAGTENLDGLLTNVKRMFDRELECARKARVMSVEELVELPQVGRGRHTLLASVHHRQRGQLDECLASLSPVQGLKPVADRRDGWWSMMAGGPGEDAGEPGTGHVQEAGAGRQGQSHQRQKATTRMGRCRRKRRLLKAATGVEGGGSV